MLFTGRWSLLVFLLLTTVLALPGAVSRLPKVRPENQNRRVNPSPVIWDPTKTYNVRRGLFDSLKDKFKDDEEIPDGEIPAEPSLDDSAWDSRPLFPGAFANFPGVHEVKHLLGMTDFQIDPLPTKVMNMPSVISVWHEYVREGLC